MSHWIALYEIPARNGSRTQCLDLNRDGGARLENARELAAALIPQQMGANSKTPFKLALVFDSGETEE